ncbi:hypothetical protein BHL54_11655 [Bacillus cereus]|nr:hypothetical protein BHL54_11655 [Bacillus cereus]
MIVDFIFKIIIKIQLRIKITKIQKNWLLKIKRALVPTVPAYETLNHLSMFMCVSHEQGIVRKVRIQG